ncbi:MAG: phosphoenolpyruvate--protein phosphotransferase [Myxococcales bacterium]|nr:phosphoenolpyruvate--protein phosphotransferase [Myxococcales bacterium]
MSSPESSGGSELRKTGIAACQGIAIGRAYIVDRRQLKVPKRQIDPDEVEGEIERFHRAIEASGRQLEKIKQKIEERERDHYAIITAHQLILRDDHVVAATIQHIESSLINAEWALRRSVEKIKSVFDAVEDDYFRERRSDVDFVGERVLRNLLGRDSKVTPPPDAIVIAHDLSPADTAVLYRAAVAGIATDVGGKTSHTAIIARGYSTPAVVGTEDLTNHVGRDDLVIVDGSAGVVIINPDPETVTEYRERSRLEIAAGIARLSRSAEPAVTQDGVSVELLANLDHLNEAGVAVSHGADGVGLCRTEYHFMASEELPTEDDHFNYAIQVMEAMGGRCVTFRTLDLGADKISEALVEPHDEANPALGLRSLRLCLTEPMQPIFRCQLRGLLRASSKGKMKVMFPMISGLEELRAAREFLADVQQELRTESIAFDEDLHVGMMIEMPSAALVADHLAKYVDFFSIGTNDLIQYTIAVDRMNELVSYLYAPLHPALLRLIQTVVEAGKTQGIPVSICGEMAGDPLVAPVLLGLGLRTLSMHAVAMPDVKEAICCATLKDVEELAARVLELESATEVRRAALEFASSRASHKERL